MGKSNTSTKPKQYALWIQGGDTSLRDPAYYNTVLDVLCSSTHLTHIQLDQILTIAVLRGDHETLLLENSHETIEALYLVCHNSGIECFYTEAPVP